MTIQDFLDAFNNAIALGEQGLEATDAIAKQYGATSVELPVEAAEVVLPILGKLVAAAVTGYSNASGTPITIETITALLPNATPLPKPPAA